MSLFEIWLRIFNESFQSLFANQFRESFASTFRGRFDYTVGGCPSPHPVRPLAGGTGTRSSLTSPRSSSSGATTDRRRTQDELCELEMISGDFAGLLGGFVGSYDLQK